MRAILGSLIGVVSTLAFVPLSGANPADLDTSFATGGTFTGEDSTCAEFRSLFVLADGRVLAGANEGGPPPDEGYMHRFLSNGSRDTSFGGGDGIIWLPDLVGSLNANVRHFDAFPSGAFAAAISDGSNRWVLRLDESGNPLTAFDGDGILEGPWNAIAKIGTDDLLVAGKNEDGHLILGRLDATGALVPSFGSGGMVTSFSVDGDGASEVLIQPDGKILVGGDKSGGFFVARFFANGSPDSSFGTNGAFEHASALENLRGMVLANDGRVLVTGCEAGSGACSQSDSPVAVRLTAAGTLDTTFDGDGIASPSGSGGESQGIAVQRNGMVLLSGHSQQVERLTLDGSLDSSFGVGGIGSTVGWEVALQRDGKILVAGSNNAGANARCQLHRLLGDPIEAPALSERSLTVMSILMAVGGLLILRRGRRSTRP